MPKKANRRERNRSVPYLKVRVPNTPTTPSMATAIASPAGLPQWRSPHLHNQHSLWTTADPSANSIDFSLPMMSNNFNMTTVPTAPHHQQPVASPLETFHPQSFTTQHHRSHSNTQIHLPGMPQQAAPWTNGEDALLLDAKSRGLGWNDIHEKYFPTKSGNACRKRHERLMVKLRTTDWDEARVRRVWNEYVREGVRREFWEPIAQRCGEQWEDVERVCFQQGLKGIRNSSQTHHHSRSRSNASSRMGGAGGNASDVGDMADHRHRRVSGGQRFEQVAEHDHNIHNNHNSHNSHLQLHTSGANGAAIDAYSDGGAGKYGDHDDSGIDIRSQGPSPPRSSNVGPNMTVQGLEVLRQAPSHGVHSHGRSHNPNHGHGGGAGYEYQ